MRSLTPNLLAAQKQAAAIPCVKVEARNKVAGVVRYDWDRLYAGSEPDSLHALTIPGDGSMVRARVTPMADSQKLYRQRVISPGPTSDFSLWTYTGQYNAVAVACAALGAEVSIFWIDGLDRRILRLKSTDYGANWDSPELVDYSPTTNVSGLAVAYKPGGDLAVFFADQTTLYVKKQVSGVWQAKSAWDKTTGDLSGVATAYSSDWDLLVTGKDSNGNFKLWSLVYGDGGDVTAATWSTLKELASAPADGQFQYCQPFLDKPDIFRGFFVEKYTGTQAYNRPFWSYSVPDAKFADSLWREPVPFNLSSEFGLAVAHHGSYCWLSGPSGVWRASSADQSLDLSADVLAVEEELGRNQGKLTVELANVGGKYSSPGTSALAVLDIGCQLDFGAGFRTASGDEVSAGQTFSLEAYEHTSSPGRASLFLHARDGWNALSSWEARHQFRWNKSSEEMSVKDMLAFVLARAGLKLDVKSESALISGFYPDFAIAPGDGGEAIVNKLLSFVPDVLLMEGHTAYLVNPLATDAAVYSYSDGHPVLEGRYSRSAWVTNRVQVEGYDGVGGGPIIVDSFAWEQIKRVYDRLARVEDRNLGSVSGVEDRGEAYLRRAEIEGEGGTILVRVNCGQQMYDVIEITDLRAGLTAARRRVLRIKLDFDTRRGEYLMRLWLGAG